MKKKSKQTRPLTPKGGTKRMRSTQNTPFGGFRGLPFGEFRGLLALLLFPFWGLGGLSAKVTVTNMAVNYPNKVSFTLTWDAPAHNNQLWVIVDYIKVENASTADNSWKRALVTGATATGNGSAAIATQTNRGFWLNTAGSSSGSANITAALSLDAGVRQFNWCAYALNYPPEAKIKPEGGYDLYGTSPFSITYNNGSSTTTDANTFKLGCITAITDATDNPAGIIPPAPAATVTSQTICYNTKATLSAAVGGGTTSPMTYTWNINGATSVTYLSTITTTQSLTATTTYTVTARNANGCTSAVSNKGTVTVRPAFTSGAIATTGQTICSGAAVTTIGNSTAASGGDNSITYQWYRNGSVISGATLS
ncbi:MAG: hypothetical protein LBU42_05190, partial [Prevotellaceae bacterium]|nr:hypothetical protein [Prevotellaceae bacterium]